MKPSTVSDDLQWQPEDYLQQLKDREACCREVIELLEIQARSDGCIWMHHLPRILDQLAFFRGLLEEEIEHYGEWRYHGFQIDKVIDFIDEDLDELTRWICRITGSKDTPAHQNEME